MNKTQRPWTKNYNNGRKEVLMGQEEEDIGIHFLSMGVVFLPIDSVHLFPLVAS